MICCNADITYFHCLDIVELLKVSEVETKNFMGQYSSQVMKVQMAVKH